MPRVTVSSYIPIKDYEAIQKHIRNRNCLNVSDFIRKAISKQLENLEGDEQ
jgi:Arc/MetJ-type ribon-helix-helix transcriptional regulator